MGFGLITHTLLVQVVCVSVRRTYPFQPVQTPEGIAFVLVAIAEICLGYDGLRFSVGCSAEGTGRLNVQCQHWRGGVPCLPGPSARWQLSQSRLEGHAAARLIAVFL